MNGSLLQPHKRLGQRSLVVFSKYRGRRTTAMSMAFRKLSVWMMAARLLSFKFNAVESDPDATKTFKNRKAARVAGKIEERTGVH